MKSYKSVITILICLLLILLLTGTLYLVLSNVLMKETNKEKEVVNVELFSAYTEIEEFQNVPAMIVEGTDIGTAVENGGNTYLVDVNGTTIEDYQTYLKLLEQSGYKQYCDNGDDYMEGAVASSTYTKDKTVLTISHALNLDKTYIMVGLDLPLSKHLNYSEEYVANLPTAAKTKIHMLELNNTGNSFVVELKNGHFVVHDGGQKEDTLYFLDFIEGLVPEGEIPIIEAWFISHAHQDHDAVLLEIATKTQLKKRLYVEGVYFTEPSKNIQSLASDPERISRVMMSAGALTTSEGEKTKLYRPQFGQRYYFCDITIDVNLTTEVFAPDTYDKGSTVNDTSIWLMHHIEGQRFLLAGDTGNIGQRAAMRIFDENYFDFDIMATFHHAINLYTYFLNTIEVDTVLYTSYRLGSSRSDDAGIRLEENALLQKIAKEAYHWSDGTVTLTFPYTVGTAEIQEPFGWKYNGGLPSGRTW